MAHRVVRAGRLAIAIAAGALVLGLAPTVRAEPRLTPEQMRELISQARAIQVRLEAQEQQLGQLRSEVAVLTTQNDSLRRELSRRGVDPDELLSAAAPTSQPSRDSIFLSPERVFGVLRTTFEKRVGAELTQLQREAAMADFAVWMNSAAMLPTQVTWVVRVGDVYRARTEDAVSLVYSSDRQPMVGRVAAISRTLSDLEILELTVERLQLEQRNRRLDHEQKLRAMVKLKVAERAAAEEGVRDAYDALVQMNSQVRQAEMKLAIARKGSRPSSQPDAQFRIIVQARAPRDQLIDLTIFCREADADKLTAAARGSLIKVRGWVTDVAVAERMATMGIRLDRAEVLVVNVQPPPATTQPQPESP